MPAETTALYTVYAGDALADVVFRIVGRCPPTTNDFLSYEALGKRYDRRDFFKGTGVSMHVSRAASWRVARVYGVGRAVATLDIRRPGIVCAATGGRGHITVWATAETLLECVVQCESHE